MGSLSLPHLILFAIVALVLFGGRNKISDIMGDVAKGIRSFKKGLSDDEEASSQHRPSDPVRSLDHQAPRPVPQNDPAHDSRQAEPRKVG